MLSPSPVSLIQYVVLTWIGAKYLKKRITYKHAMLMSLVQSFLIVAAFVVVTDAFWVGFQAIKFIPMFPQDANQILFSFGRDVVAALLFFLLIGDHFRTGVISFNYVVKAGLLMNLEAQAVWFLLAPSPAYTDYTFAWKYGYPLETVLAVWIVSHFIMRIPLWISVITAFRKGRKPK